jgi:hypothetical protein
MKFYKRDKPVPKPATVAAVSAEPSGESVAELEQALAGARSALAKARERQREAERAVKAGAAAALASGNTATLRAQLADARDEVRVAELAVEELTERLEEARASARRAEVDVVRRAVAEAIQKRGEAAERLGKALHAMLDAFAEVERCGKEALDVLSTVSRFGVTGLRPQATVAEPLRGSHVAHLCRIELATHGGESWRYERTPLMGFPIGLVKLLQNDGDAFLAEVLEKLQRAEALPSSAPQPDPEGDLPHAA